VAGKTPASTPVPAPPGPQTPPSAPADQPKKPLELSANSVEVHVLRSGVKNDLDRLWCEGAVHVHQEPESAEQQGTDIQGDTMQLNNAPEGGILVVNGKLARVVFDKLSIMGPEVKIDQRSNQAWVEGIGAMLMLSDTNFDGAKLAKPTPLTVHWRDAMYFNGMNAEFQGDVEAEQKEEHSRLLCRNMTVAFDRPISLKEGNKGGPSPKVDKLLCEGQALPGKEVQIEEVIPPDPTRPGPTLPSIKRLTSPEVNIDNAAKFMTASGPGQVRIFQLGNADETLPGQTSPTGKPRPAAPGKPPEPKEPKQEFKITHVRYDGQMQARQGLAKEDRTAKFWGNVEAVNVPSDQPDLLIDPDHLPPGGLYVRSEILTVRTSRLDGRSNQEMIAEKKVLVRAQEFWGIAETVKYEEALDRVIFEGGKGGRATVYQSKILGAEQGKLSGTKIYYYRRTNDFKVEGGDGLSSN
jgi:hypothetical protein